jgi:hypothetical protein
LTQAGKRSRVNFQHLQDRRQHYQTSKRWDWDVSDGIEDPEERERKQAEAEQMCFEDEFLSRLGYRG